MFVGPTTTCHPSVYPLYSLSVIHVCGTYYYLSFFCLTTILSVMIHVCTTY